MPPSQVALATICDVTTVQLSNGTIHKFYKILLFTKKFLTSRGIKMIVHAFMIELDQLD